MSIIAQHIVFANPNFLLKIKEHFHTLIYTKSIITIKKRQIISGLTTIYDITATGSIKVNIIKRASKNFSLKTKIN